MNFLRVCLLLFYIMLIRSIRIVCRVVHSSSLLWRIPLCEYTTFYFSTILWLMGTWGCYEQCHYDHLCTCLLMNRWTHVCWVYVYPGAESLGLCSALIDSAKRFSKVVVPVYTPTAQ